MKITILGCGGSSGVPLVGGEDGAGFWGDCNPNNPKNRRTRASIIVQHNDKRLLIDTSPDLRQQLLDNNIKAVDAIAYTHAHADHCHGIDDIRSLNFHANSALPAYADEKTLAELQERFSYVFAPFKADQGFYKPSLNGHVITPNQPFQAAGMDITPFMQDHGWTHSIGYRIGNFAYSTDCKAFPDESLPYLQNLDLWVVDALQINPHPTHSHLPQTLAWVEKFKPKQVVLIHLNTALDYDWVNANTPDNVQAGYDGMVIELD